MLRKDRTPLILHLTNVNSVGSRIYLEAYEQCAVPNERNFRDQAELDAEIKRQIALGRFDPDLQLKIRDQVYLGRLVERIRNTWIQRYGFTFDAEAQENVRPVAMQNANNGGVLRPTSLTWKADHYVPPRGLKQGGGQNASNTSTAAGKERPDITTARMPLQEWQLALPRAADFTITAPKTSMKQKPHFTRRGPWQFAGKSVLPKPILGDQQDPILRYFSIYKTFDDIRTDKKRIFVKRIHDSMPGVSVARCMEALWRCSDDVEKAKTWLAPKLNIQGKHVIVISDSENGDEEDNGEQGGEMDEALFWELDNEGDEPDHGRANKKQKVSVSFAPSASKKASKNTSMAKQKKHKRQEFGNLQKPSEKARSNLRDSPILFASGADSLPSIPQPDATVDFIPLEGPTPAPSSGHVNGTKRPVPGLKRKVRVSPRPSPHFTFTDQRQAEVIDLTTQEDELSDGIARMMPPVPAIPNTMAPTGQRKGSSTNKAITIEHVFDTELRPEEVRKLQSIAAEEQKATRGRWPWL